MEEEGAVFFQLPGALEAHCRKYKGVLTIIEQFNGRNQK